MTFYARRLIKMLEIRGAMMAKSDYREGGHNVRVYEKDAEIITQFMPK